MTAIILGTIFLSVLHALIPSHWLPLLAISRNYKWTNSQTLWVTLYMGMAHVLSTVVLGVMVSFLGQQLHHQFESYFNAIASAALIILGVIFIYRHYTHHHFHIDNTAELQQKSKSKIIWSLVTIMFISPCLEVEGFFFKAGEYGIYTVFLIAVIYMAVSILGMLSWMWVALHGIKKMDWHKIDHNAGLITGFVLILSGIITYFIH